MKKVLSFYQDSFLKAINQAITTNGNSILVLKGFPAKILDTLDPTQVVDQKTFYLNAGETSFSAKWISQNLATIASSPLCILSFAQFSYLKDKLDNEALNRVVVIEDNLRRVFPILKKEYCEPVASLEQNIEARPNKLPAYQAEQFDINSKYYYVAGDSTLTDAVKVVPVFTDLLPLVESTDQEIEKLDLSDPYAIDILINECLAGKIKNTKFGVNIELQDPLTTSLRDKLPLINQVLAANDVELVLCTSDLAYKEAPFSKETEELYHKYWTGKEHPGFKTFKIFKNPTASKELQDLSQGEIVQTIIDEYHNSVDQKEYRDLFLTAPTGAGKSLLFQLPAFHIAELGDVTIVVTPLIALMKDQVQAIVDKRKFKKVAYLNSELSLQDRDKVIEQCKAGKIDILYLSPELLLAYDISFFIGERNLGLLVIDEAHLITTWGRDFRVDYWFLGTHLQRMRQNPKYNFPIIAVTATAVFGGDNDMVFDTLDSLCLKNAHRYIGSVKRENISFVISNYDRFDDKFIDNKELQTIDFAQTIATDTKFKTLIYTPFTKQTERVERALSRNGIDEAAFYHGRLHADVKQENYEQFERGTKRIMVATKAFGMGVDVDDIELIYHHSPSSSMPDYIQEIGRAARHRDIQGFAAINYNEQDKYFSNLLHNISSLAPHHLKEVLLKIHLLYKWNQKKNMLISVDDFAHIFNNSQDMDQKVLAALMMIEKDYFNKYGFHVLTARPKKLFLNVFAKVATVEVEGLLKKYDKAISILPYDVQSDFTFLEIDLDKVWSAHYASSSYEEVSRKFYANQLFMADGVKVVPQIKISYQLTQAQSPSQSLELMKSTLETLAEALDSMKGVSLIEEDFVKAINGFITDNELALKLSKFIIGNYIGTTSGHYMNEKDKFLQANFIQGIRHYTVHNDYYRTEFTNLISKFEILFLGDDHHSFRYLSSTGNQIYFFNMLGYYLELLELGSYESVGSDKSQLFIRLNDPERIAIDAQQETSYANGLLEKTLNRHHISNDIFDHFFTSTFDSDTRWNYIEDFFLGASNEELFKKYPKTELDNKATDLNQFFIDKSIELAEQAKKDNGGREPKSNHLASLFLPEEEKFFNGDSNMTLPFKNDQLVLVWDLDKLDDYEMQTRSINKWLAEDPVSLDRVKIRYKLRVDNETYAILTSKLHRYPEYLTRKLGLKKLIPFPNYSEPVMAGHVFNENPVRFYQWYFKEGGDKEVHLSMINKIKLIDMVKAKNASRLLPEHKKM